MSLSVAGLIVLELLGTGSQPFISNHNVTTVDKSTCRRWNLILRSMIDILGIPWDLIYVQEQGANLCYFALEHVVGYLQSFVILVCYLTWVSHRTRDTSKHCRECYIPTCWTWTDWQPIVSSRCITLVVHNDAHTRDHFLDGSLDPTRGGELVMNLFSLVLPVKKRKEGFCRQSQMHISWASGPMPSQRRGCTDST